MKGSEKLLPKAPMKGRVKVPSSPPDLDGADARLRQPCGASASRRGRIAPTGRKKTQKIREWALAKRVQPNPRGRVSQDIKNAYTTPTPKR